MKSNLKTGCVKKLKAAVHRLAHVPCDSVQNKFVGPTLNSKSRTVVQSSSILRFSTSSAAFDRAILIAGLLKYVLVRFSVQLR